MNTQYTAAQPLDLDKLEALALKADGDDSWRYYTAFQEEFIPSTILALIAQARTARLDTTASASIAQLKSDLARALDEINRLVSLNDSYRAQLAQQGQEPIRWEYRVSPVIGSPTHWRETSKDLAEWYTANPQVEFEGEGVVYEVRALYAAPASAQPDQNVNTTKGT